MLGKMISKVTIINIKQVNENSRRGWSPPREVLSRPKAL